MLKRKIFRMIEAIESVLLLGVRGNGPARARASREPCPPDWQHREHEHISIITVISVHFKFIFNPITFFASSPHTSIKHRLRL